MTGGKKSKVTDGVSTSVSPGLVIRSQSGFYWVFDGQKTVRCTARNRLKQGRRAVSDLVVVGDQVRISIEDVPAGSLLTGVVEEVYPRRSRFSRRQPGGRGMYKEAVLVANIDLLLVVFSVSVPAFNPRLLDRFLAIAEYGDLDVEIIANKIDDEQTLGDGLAAAFQLYEQIGYTVHTTSTVTQQGISALAKHISGKISAFVGPSGVGKSSLLKALAPGQEIKIGALSDTLDKGRHTTRRAELIELAEETWIADTPGIRELAAFELPLRELSDCFRDLRDVACQCKFSDCDHISSHGCAVQDAVASGQISSDRYDSYKRMYRSE